MSRQMRRIAVPKRFMLPMRDIVLMQPRFERRSGRRAVRFLEHPRFRAAYDFLLLRAASGEVDPELANWWTRLQEMPEAERIAEVERQPRTDDAAPRARSRRRRRHRAA
jgi:poly(A) polymerase